MKILITGSNGLLGQKLVKLLHNNAEVELIATGRGPNRLTNLDKEIRYEEMDITLKDDVHNVIFRHKPDAVIHTAALTQVDDCEKDKELCWKMNVSAAEYVAKACAETGAFLVHLSTDFIFDGEEGPYDEEANPNPISYYGESKLASEKIVMEHASDWAIVRTVLVYGIAEDMSRSNIILWVKKNLEEGRQIKVVNDQWRTPTLAEDLAMGCYLVAKSKAPGIYNISGKDFLTPYDMALMTAGYFKLDESLIIKADASTFSQPARRPPKTGFHIDKARKNLGYEPHSFEEGIAIVAKQLGMKP